MFKHPRYLLSDPELAPARVGTRWGFRPLLVLARHLYLSFQLDARGVPWHQTAAFVALQCKRQAPFTHAAGAYVRQRDVIFVWAWSAGLQDAALARLEVEARRAEVLPESLLGPVIEDGALVRPCVVGTEGLRFERGSLTDAIWWTQPPEAAVSSAWAGAVVGPGERLTAMQRVAASRVWARRWRALVPVSTADTPDSTVGSVGRHAVLMAGLAILCASAAMLGFAHREHQLLQAALAATQLTVDTAVASRSMPVGKPAVSESAHSGDGLWEQAQAATRGLQFEHIWAGLARSFGDSGYVLRDFSYDREEVRLTLVSAYGGNLDLGHAIVMLESSGLWRRVEILDFSNAAAVRFGVKPRDELFQAFDQ